MSPDNPDPISKLASEGGLRGQDHSGQKLAWIVILVAIVTLALGATGSIFLLRNPDITQTLRDIVIIWIALEALVIGAALITLAIQLARLTSLLRHEVKPILENTGDTIKTLRSTARFVSDNIAEPVVKFSGTVAGIQRFLGMLSLVGPRKRKRR